MTKWRLKWALHCSIDGAQKQRVLFEADFSVIKKFAQGSKPLIASNYFINLL